MTSITGTTGADILNGGNSNDIIDAGKGDDSLYGGLGADILYGGAGADILDGGDGADYIEGGDGNDVINNAGTGDILIDGGAGVDYADLNFATATSGITFSLADTATAVIDVQDVHIKSIEQVRFNAGSGDDTIHGGALSDSLYGGAGFDILYGEAGADLIDGGDGNDIIVGGLGNDTLMGRAGDDILHDMFGSNTFDGGDGFDIAVIDRSRATGDIVLDLQNSDAVQTLDDGTSVVRVEQVTLYTGSGIDTLMGGNGNDAFYGGAGNDHLQGRRGNDTLDGGAGADTLVGGEGDDTLIGGGGNDWIIGNVGADSISGGDGDDLIQSAGFGDVLVDGGNGIDNADLDFAETNQAINFSVLDTRTATVNVAGTDIRNIEQVRIWAGGGDDTIHGGNLGDSLYGGGGFDILYGETGNDFVYGGEGNDIVVGGAGADALYGGQGDDILHDMIGTNAFDGGDGFDIAVIDRRAASTAIVLDLNAPGVTQTLDDGTTVVNIEQATLYTGSGADQLIGGAGNDAFYGGAGADKLYGGAGNDTIDGGVSADYMVGGQGDDALTGGTGSDYIEGGEGADTIDAGGDNDTIVAGAGDVSIDGGAGTDFAELNFELSNANITFSVSDNLKGWVNVAGTQVRGVETVRFLAGSGDDTIHGGQASEEIYGGGGFDILYGENGDDSLYGGAGDDIVVGGAGNDTLKGGAGNDILHDAVGVNQYDGGDGVDTAVIDHAKSTQSMSLDLSNPSVLQTLEDGSTVINVEAAVVSAGSAADIIKGGEGNDSIFGGAGADIIAGGAGTNYLYGGLGDDQIDGSYGVDTIDGGAGNDVITMAGLGDVLIDGGAGTDFAELYFGLMTTDIHLSLADTQGAAVNVGGVDVKNIEQMIFYSGQGSDEIRGGALADRIVGNGGNDTLWGLSGNDRLEGDAGDDILVGGEGNDTLYGGADYDTLQAGTGVDTVDGGAGDDIASFDRSASTVQIKIDISDSTKVQTFDNGSTVVNVEGLIVGAGSGDDILIGGAINDFFYGGKGNDFLDGRGGGDSLLGWEGNDVLVGGSGYNTLDGGAGQDSAVFDGYRADYKVERLADGGVKITDLRAGHYSENIIHSVETYTFSDRSFTDAQLDAPNQAPVAVADSFEIGEDGVIEFKPTLNDYDPDGDAVVLSSVNYSSTTGQGQLLAGETIRYTPGANLQYLKEGESFTDTVLYSVRDDKGGVTQSYVHITVHGANDAPTALADEATMQSDDGSLTINVLANDYDKDHGDTLSITGLPATSESGATLSLDANGKVVYDPGDLFLGLPEGETLTDTFTYTVTDPDGLTSTASVTVVIHGVAEQVPIWGDSLVEDATSANYYDDLLNIVRDNFGSGTKIVGVDTSGTIGSVNFNAGAHVLTFTADDPSSDTLWGDLHQDTGFGVLVETSSGAIINAFMSIRITGINDAPIAGNDSFVLTEGQTSGNLWSTLLSNDVDDDSNPYFFTITGVSGAGTLGELHFNAATKSLTYEADDAAFHALAPGQTLTDTFTYTMKDDQGNFSTATVTVTVVGDDFWP